MLSKEILMLYNEWKLWSKCYGKMIFVNGICSSGKTKLCKELTNIGFYYISSDEIVKEIILCAIKKIPQFSILRETLSLDDIYANVCCTSKINKIYSQNQLEALQIIKQNKYQIERVLEEGNVFLKLYQSIYQYALKYILSGQNVVVEGIILSQEEMEITKSFFDFTTYVVLLYAPLERVLENCFNRNLIALQDESDNFRSPYYILRQFMQIYRFNPNSSKGIKINSEAICSMILKSRENIKETLLPPRENDEIATKEQDMIVIAHRAFQFKDTVYICSELLHDLVITLPNRKINKVLEDFLISYVNDLDNSIILTAEISEYILFSNKVFEIDLESTTQLNRQNVMQLDSNFKSSCIICYVNEFHYENLLVNNQELLIEAYKIGGIQMVNKLVEIGKDLKSAKAIITMLKQHGVQYLIDILFIKPFLITPILLLKVHEIEKITEQNFFLDSNEGRDFIQVVANQFDEEILLIILELGKNQDIAEQIVFEAATQGIDKIVYTLLGRELPVTGTTDNLENVIGTEELNQLQIVPNGILSSWSNNAYKKIINYIDNLSRNLDNLLNIGRSGNQVAIIVALLEEWLNYAASGQKFLGCNISPYYDPNNDDHWSYGGSSGSDENNNSSAGSFDNGFTGLILPLYNGTNYNITDHQM